VSGKPSMTDVRAAATHVEREACIDFIRDRMSEVDRLRSRGRIPEGEAKLLNRRLDAIADGIAAGLHR
jgi:hypothetical protein